MIALRARGFTLIELAIVFLIIGLLTGGILVGQTLIGQSQLQQILPQFEKYKSAVSRFRDKYNSLPGDMPDAAPDYWPEVSGGCTTAAGSGKQTCNGNGNGKSGNLGSGTENYELFRAWQHLANAAMIEGNFTGVAGGGGATHCIPETNSPSGKLPASGFSLYYPGHVMSGDANYFDGEYDHVVSFGANTGTTVCAGPSLTPLEAFKLDEKADDGRPATGTIRGMKSTSGLNPGCTTAATASASYNSLNTNVLCGVIAVMGNF